MAQIRAYEPPEDWLLPDEQTDDQHKLARVEREVKQAIERVPTVVAGFKGQRDEQSTIVSVQPIVVPLEATRSGDRLRSIFDKINEPI